MSRYKPRHREMGRFGYFLALLEAVGGGYGPEIQFYVVRRSIGRSLYRSYP